jgi:Protein kinase domain
VADRLRPGDVVGGFRVERVIGAGPRAVVYEATQLGLNRSVALKLLPSEPKLALSAWPDHPHVVSMYAAGGSEHGQFVAMQLVRGRTLAELLKAGKLQSRKSVAVLKQVAQALDALHRLGVVHRGVEAHNVFVNDDGHALVTDVGLGSAPATPEADRAAFEALVEECLGELWPGPADPPPSSAATIVERAVRALPDRPRRRWLSLGAAAVAGGTAVVVTAAVVGDSDNGPRGAPPILRGAQVLGSRLHATGVDSLDCQGRPPTGASQECTLVQTRLPGQRLRAERSGAIRRWVVRGARGELALLVLRRKGRQFVSVARTPYELVPDRGVHALTANLPIRAGELVGLQVAPGAELGVHRGVTGAATARSFGPLTFAVRPVHRGPGTGFDHELLLRVEYLPGARATVPGRLSRLAARRAPNGVRLDERVVEPRRGLVRTVAVVRVGDRVAVDLFDGGRRLERLPVRDADAGGRLLSWDSIGEPTVHLSWRNPGGRVIAHDYAVGSRSLFPSG